MIVNLGVRALQLLFSFIVLALSAALVANYGPGHAPSLLSFGAFCGVFSMLVAAVGVVACFIETLQGLPMVIADGLTAFLVAAASIAFAVQMKVGNCADTSLGGYLYNTHKSLFRPSNDKWYSGRNQADINAAGNKDVTSRCRMAQADTAMLYFSLACTLGAIALTLLSKRSGKGGSIV